MNIQPAKKNLVFLGPPGAGKGTLAVMLAADAGIAHISTGDIFRAEIKNGTELGKKAKQFVESGGLVPDELVADMVISRLREKDCDGGFMLDGFPRTVNQAELLASGLEKIGRGIDAVVLIHAEEDLLLRRMTSRVICRKCGAVFNTISSPPAQEGVCDQCGGELYQRPDDSLETATDRLRVYREQTSPLVELYEEKGLLLKVDGGLGKDAAYPELLAVLE